MRGHREATLREIPRNGRGFGNCRLRQLGETVGALCVTGVSYPPLQRAPGTWRRSVDPPGEPDRLRTRAPTQADANASVSALSALHAVGEPGTSRVPMTTRVHISVPRIPLQLLSGSRAHAPIRAPRGNRFWSPRNRNQPGLGWLGSIWIETARGEGCKSTGRNAGAGIRLWGCGTLRGRVWVIVAPWISKE